MRTSVCHPRPLYVCIMSRLACGTKGPEANEGRRNSHSHIRAYLRVSRHASVHERMRTFKHDYASMFSLTHVHMHVYKCTYTYTYIYIYTYMYPYVSVFKGLWSPAAGPLL